MTEKRIGLIILALFIRMLPAASAIGQTAYPMLMSVKPVAVQVGTTADVVLNSRYTLFGAYQVLISGEGVSGELALSEMKQEDAAKKPDVTKLTLKLTAAADALPGVRDLRVATPQGVSTVGQVVIVRDAVIVEAAKNDTPQQAQEITLPAAMCGAIEKNEDVDYFKFHVAAGESLAFRVHCARLEDRIHDLQTHADPIITLRTDSGATIASSDNATYFADPVLSHRFDQAGDYVLEIRDVRYQGNQYWEYCIEVSSRPMLACTYPLAVAAGQPESLQPLGYLMPEGAAIAWSGGADNAPGLHFLALPLSGEQSNPVRLLVADVPLVRELSDVNDAPEASQSLPVPCGVNGRIERDGDIDRFAFEAKKGEAFSLEIVARRLGSALDSHVRILDEKGKQLALNDDLRLGKRTLTDSWIENWVAPADGNYTVEVRDVNLRGGPDYPYFLKITHSQPYFELYLDSDKTEIVPGGCGRFSSASSGRMALQARCNWQSTDSLRRSRRTAAAFWPTRGRTALLC